MTVAAPAADPTSEAPERRTFAITCRNPACRHNFTRRLAKGYEVTCPRCKVVQPGPARIEELEKLEAARLASNRRRREKYRAQKNGNGADPPDPPSLDHEDGAAQTPAPPSPPDDEEPLPARTSPPPPPRAPNRWTLRSMLTGDGW